MISKRVLYCVFTIVLFTMMLTGAVSAEDPRSVENGSFAFVYENISILDSPEATTLTYYNGNEQSQVHTITAVNGVFVLSEIAVNGKYGRYYYSGSPSAGTGKYLEISYPEISLKAELTDSPGDSIDGKTINKRTNVSFIIDVPKVGPANIGATAKIIFTTPTGGKGTTFGYDAAGNAKDYSSINLNQAQVLTGAVYPGRDSAAGTWTAQAKYTTPTKFSDHATKSNAVSFTVQSTTLTITAAKDSVDRINPFTVTIQGDSNTLYAVYLSGLQTIEGLPTLQSSQTGFKNDYTSTDLGLGYSALNGIINYTTGDTTVAVGGIFETDASGKRIITFNTGTDTQDKTYTINVSYLRDQKFDSEYDSVKVKVESGAVTISALGDGSYHIGDEIKLTGTNTDSNNVYLFITGTGLAENGIVLKDLPTRNAAHLAQNPVAVKTDNTWEYKWDTTNCGLDTGTYTIYATSRLTNGKAAEASGNAVKLADARYDSVLITLQYRSFTVGIGTLPGNTLTIYGNGEGISPPKLAYYLMHPAGGFTNGTLTIDENGSYKIDIVITTGWPSGIYYAIVERPASDGSFATLDEAALRRIISGGLNPGGKYAVAETVVGTGSAIPPSSASGNITIESLPNAAHIGETISFSGKNTGSESVYLFITGPNLDPYGYQLSKTAERGKAGKAENPTTVVNDGGWTYQWDTTNCKLDTGIYTIYATDRLTNGKGTIIDGNAVSILSADYASATIELKMPYLTMAPSAYYVQKGETLSVTGIATGNPNTLAYYLFGPNSYLHGTTTVDTDGSYEIRIPTTSDWESNQYFLVVEHPMYNKEFDIIETKTDTTTTLSVKPCTSYTSVLIPITVEGVDKVRGINAADALIGMIDSANVDDIYGKYTFTIYEGSVPAHGSRDDDGSGNQLIREVVSESFTPVGNLKPGEKATAAMNIKFQEVTTSYRIHFATGLTTPEWSAAISDQWGDLLTLPHDIPDYIDGWLVSDYPQSTILTLRVEGTVPDTIGKEISQLIVEEFDSGDSRIFRYASPKQLIITEGTEVSAILPLSKGWNFISIPKTLETGTNTAEKLFARVDTDNHLILGYNAQTSSWEAVTGTDIIKPLTGYWIYAKEPSNLLLSFTKDPATPAVKTAYPGWNAVGLSATEETDARNAFAGTEWRTALPWNLSKGSYGTAVINGGTGNSDPAVNSLQPGWGYWLYTEEQGTLTGLTA